MSTSGHLKFQGTNRATFVGTTSNIMFDTTSTSLGIGVTGTDHPSSNLYITGNAYVSSNIAVGGVLTMGTVNVVARHDLEAVTATGNITPLTLEFTNPTTSLVASGNVVVTGNVTADYFVGDGSNITGISSTLQAITDSGPGANVTSNTVQFSNAITGLVTTANVEVGGELTVSGNVVVDTNTLFVDSVNNRVGVGTVSPIASLDIDGGPENDTVPALSIRGGLYDTSDLYVLNTYSVNTGAGYAAKVIGVNIKNKVETDNTVQLRNNVGGLTSAGAIYLGSDNTNQGVFGVLTCQGSAGTTLTEKFTITDSGNACFGTGHTNAVGTVDIDPSAGRTFGSQTGPGHTPPLYVTASVGSSSNGVEFRHSNQSQGIGFGYNTIYATGGTGTSAAQDLSLKAYNNGTVRLDGGTAISSDDRLKTNEEYITNATETLLKLKPQLYDKHKKINETCENPMREAGLITQDVYYDAPELRFLVHARNEGMDAIIPVNIPEEKPFVDEDPTKDPDYSGWGTDTASLNYEGFIPYLIKTIQELHERIDALENA